MGLCRSWYTGIRRLEDRELDWRPTRTSGLGVLFLYVEIASVDLVNHEPYVKQSSPLWYAENDRDRAIRPQLEG